MFEYDQLLDQQFFDELANIPDPYGVPNKMKFQAGDEVEVVGNMAGHNQVGLRTSVIGYQGQFVRLDGSQFNFYEMDLKLLACPKAKVVERAQKARAQYHLWQAKVDYLESTGSETLDNEAFKKYAVKKLVENQNLSSDDKVNMIQSIFTEE